MARAIKLEPNLSLPLCTALLGLQTRKFWKSRGRHGNRKGTDTCGNFASYLIDNRYYCRKHAAYVALEILERKK
jgi:hypothetical protein